MEGGLHPGKKKKQAQLPVPTQGPAMPHKRAPDIKLPSGQVLKQRKKLKQVPTPSGPSSQQESQRPTALLSDTPAPGTKKKRSVSHFTSPAFWESVCPALTVCGLGRGPSPGLPPPLQLPSAFRQDARQQVDSEGAVVLPAEQLAWRGVDFVMLAAAVRQLIAAGWPPSFIVMFDQVWALVHQLDSVMREVTGNTCNMDILAWHVDPGAGAAGFAPHRDRQPDDSPATFRADGSAMYTTAWVPFVDATPENSCLYVVPRWADPGYFVGDDDDGPDPLTVAVPHKEGFQAIRALPATAGSAVVFTHRTIHWGSRGRPSCPQPRISLSFGCAGPEFEAPYFSREHLPLPPVELRAALACGQMIVYHERFQFTRRQLADFHSVFTQHSQHFTPAYHASVLKEFAAACLELEQQEGQAPAPPLKPLAPASRPGHTPHPATASTANGKGHAAGGAARAAARGAAAADAAGRGEQAEEEEEDQTEAGAAGEEDEEDDLLDAAMEAMLDAKLMSAKGRKRRDESDDEDVGDDEDDDDDDFDLDDLHDDFDAAEYVAPAPSKPLKVASGKPSAPVAGKKKSAAKKKAKPDRKA